MKALFFSLILLFAASCSVNAAGIDEETQRRWVSAIASDNVQRLTHLLEQHEDNAATLLTLTASNGKSALMVACKLGDEALARALVSHGADIRAKTITDGTAFMFAVLGDQQSMAQWLKGLGADINAQGSNGWTSVMIAAAKGLDDTLAWLLDEGANAQTPDVYGFTPLMRAVDNNHIASVRQLVLLDKVNVNWKDELDNTALHYAVSNQNLENVKQLLTVKASPSIENLSGDTPWSLVNEMQIDSMNEPSKAAVTQIRKELQQALEAR